MASIFNFVTKEGKHFAPIANTITKYIVQDGAVIEDGTKIVSGVKGVYAKVRIELGSSSRAIKAELFAVNTEMFQSSN